LKTQTSSSSIPVELRTPPSSTANAMPQTSAPRKPGAGMMMQQTQPKLQHQPSLLPPANLEDIDDDEEMKYDSLHPIRNR
jgi:hypothetical protein